MSSFAGKTLMITGGTGSFGNTVLKHFVNTEFEEIRIFSRDEKKQDDMRHRLQQRSPELASKVRFFIGDVRDAQSVRDAMHGVNYIFHAAALKQVPSCEFFPMEAVRTNVIGTDNVLHAAIAEGVEKVVCLSTDKAAYPINAMGKSKAMMESIIYANARNGAGRTTICCTRYGNVMCSRGSVIPLFIDRIRKGEPLTVTDPSMTRFLMNLDEAVDLVQFAFENANPGDLFVQKAPASTIGDLAEAVQEVFGHVGTKVIGTRHGEKLYETLMTCEERLRAEDMGNYYRVACDSRDLNKGEPLTVTDPSMTRFLMNLDEAVDLVQFAFENANPGDLFVQKAPASTIGDLAEAVQEVFGHVGTKVIGTRHGEKLYETLMTCEERLRAEDMGNYYRVACDSRDLNYDSFYDSFFVEGDVKTQADEAYTSHNTERLDIAGTVEKIKTAEYVQLALEGREHEAVQ